MLGGWRDTRMLITFGTPYRGSLNALNSLANGFRKSIGPLTLVDLSGLVRSFTSVYQLLPIYPCYDPGSGLLQRVGEVSGIPNVDAARARAALDFHNEIRLAVERNDREAGYGEGRYTLHPVVGTFQPTLQIARRASHGLEMLDRHPQEPDITGDGTVPQVSATPIEPETLARQHHKVFIAEVHGSLQNSRPVLDGGRPVLDRGGGARQGRMRRPAGHVGGHGRGGGEWPPSRAIHRGGAGRHDGDSESWPPSRRHLSCSSARGRRWLRKRRVRGDGGLMRG